MPGIVNVHPPALSDLHAKQLQKEPQEGSPMNTSILPTTTEEFKPIVHQYESLIEFLEERVGILQKALLGSKSEKSYSNDEEGNEQLRMFKESEVLVEQKLQPPTTIPEHTR
jgi:hypothetical protein